MAAGLVYHNLTTAAGVTFTVAKWVPDTTAPNVGALPVHVILDSTGVPITQTNGALDINLKSGGNSNGRKIPSSSAPVVQASQDYKTVAASQTATVLGATGATGDWLDGILVIPATTSPGNVLLLDNVTSITVFTGGASSVTNLVPFFIPIGAISASGAWKITTGANVSVVATGNFT